jgi:multiple sugar transport system substrate-binding protein
MPRRLMRDPGGGYVNGQSGNKAAAWDFVKFLTNAANGFRLTEMTGMLASRLDIDWKPLLARTPQFEAFLSPPAGIKYYADPVFTAFDEAESRLADRLTSAYIDPSLKGNPANVAAKIHEMAAQTDQILKDAKLYGID